MKTFQDEIAAKIHLKKMAANGDDMALVDGPNDGEFTVMPIKDAEEFDQYITSTRNGNLCIVTLTA